MTLMGKKGYVFWLVVWLSATLLYVCWLRGLVPQVFHGTAPAWFTAIVDWTYPRFGVEKHRFELAFFVRHADQIVIRLGLVNAAALALVVTASRRPAIRDYWAGFWNLRVSAARMRFYRVFFYAGILFFTYDWHIDLAYLHQAAAFYQPVPLLRLLRLPFPPPWVSGLLCGLLVASTLLVVSGFQKILFSTVAAVLFTLLQGWLFSFEKVDHAFAPMTYALWLMPLVLRQHQKNEPMWALQLLRLFVGLVYLQAGLEKLLVGGWEWLSPDTFRNYLYLHPTALGGWVAAQNWLCVVLPLGALLFQLGFVSVVFAPRLRWVFLPAGVLFHAGTYALMHVGGYMNAWVWLYAFFI